MKSKGHTLGIRLIESTPQETSEGTNVEDMEDVEIEGMTPTSSGPKQGPE